MDNEIQITDRARQITIKLVELKKKASENFVEAGELFKEIRDNELWKIEGAESFNSYIAEIGYERTSAFKMILVYEKFFEGRSVESIQQTLDAGWAKLSRLAPHTDERNEKVMLELATNSLSDIETELVRQGYVTRKETEPDFVECPFCHKSFVPLKRQDTSFKQEDYNKIFDVYKKVKEIEISGKEYQPLQQSIKTMFLNGRTLDQIIKAIEWLGDNAEYEWTLKTLTTKIPEILSKMPRTAEKTEFEKRWEQK